MKTHRPTVRPTRLRRPDYTGTNRCMPCTLVNLGIAVVIAGALAVVSLPLAASVGVASLASIYFRGYLVPGTPTLTKRYLPGWIRDRFGSGETTIEASDVDPSVVLIGAGVLVDEPAVETHLEAGFATAWDARASALLHGEESVALESLARTADVSTDELAVETVGNTVSVYLRDEHLGQWESAAAFCLDLAGMELLGDRVGGWDRFGVASRSELVGALRLFVERCPDCGGSVELDGTTVSSCCSTRNVAVVACTNCGARVLELDVDVDGLRADGRDAAD